MGLLGITGLVARERKREEYLVKSLKEAMRTGSASHVKLKILNQHLEAMYIECIVRVRLRAVGCKGIKAIGCARVMEVQCGKGSAVRSLEYQQGEFIDEPKETCETFQELFSQLFSGRLDLDNRMDLTYFLARLLHLSRWDAECY